MSGDCGVAENSIEAHRTPIRPLKIGNKLPILANLWQFIAESDKLRICTKELSNFKIF
jgi:hypothetical protein